MKQVINTLVTQSITILSLVSCMAGPAFLSQVADSDQDASIALNYEQSSASIVDADGETHEISTSVPSDFFSTGSLAISLGSDLMSDVDMDSVFSIASSEEMSASVNVSSDENVSIAAIGSIFITIPFSEAQSLALAETTYAVLYHVEDDDNASWTGLIMSDEYEDLGTGLKFPLKGFGNYQIVKIPAETAKPQPKKMGDKPKKASDSVAPAENRFEGILLSDNLKYWFRVSDTLDFYSDVGFLF